ncbi:MAG TPA: FumA C-terminus/TtdB family hydratase beta subunit [bacterium]|mgnify:CR=1 FL=1|nr:FumA C-terminus/TtdB family hydratase beta subunit [bacterium]HQG44121.1 FumA C-terminus/TtdB family hydratase beta subunit [bacterium]HQI49651.1 FumA C-terminus/TtdB family hydratase beta subunit [bacterium]HQJ64346.1 FumA C-terminus/TtdB family hydratase beta subunit [bacterium]HQJ65458.1 FumA C-terminus/TtdB family hydratase beta subunit [bacterium]
MDYTLLQQHLFELIRRTSAFLPRDVEVVLADARGLEEPESRARLALEMVALDIGLARQRSAPICQDTGTLTFYLRVPVGADQIAIRQAIEAAVVDATRHGYLRQNSVDSLTGRNSGNNLGPGSPVCHFEQGPGENLDIRLILKGGGCENTSAQFMLPATFDGVRYNRDLQGVHACILQAVLQAQGHGCGPGFLGVCIGGDRATGYAYAKEQLLRPVDDVNPVPALADLEARVVADANRLGIGPMGFGGRLTLGGCKIGSRNRLPASFFVSVAYMCWAYRRRGLLLDAQGTLVDWLYHEAGEFAAEPAAPAEMVFDPARVRRLQAPLDEATVRSLAVGEIVLLSGTLFTGRDAVHKYLHEGGELEILRGGIIYHCGPVVIEAGGRRQVVAAGPTSSIREEPYAAEIIAKYGLKAIIGKGGMGERTRQALAAHGAVYLHAIGGAAQIYARCVEEVVSVHLEELGSPEAVWELRVRDFPAVVTIDAHGRSLHQEVLAASGERLQALMTQ